MGGKAGHPCAARSETGAVLLVVLVLLLAVTASSVSFIWFMNQQQTRAGARYQSAKALAAAEAGVHWALAYLEAQPTRLRASTTHNELLRSDPAAGQFTILIAPEPDGAFVVTSSGTVGGATRRVRTRVYLASPAMLAALYGRGIVRFENPPSTTVILPYGAATGDWPWVHIASGQGVWLASASVLINRRGPDRALEPGPIDPSIDGKPASLPLVLPPIRFLFGRDAELLIDQSRQRVDEQQLRVVGVNVDRVVRLYGASPLIPEVDRGLYRDMARRNTANARLNQAAGEFAGDRELAHKRDSLYSRRQLEQMQQYLKAIRQPFQLHGTIYIPDGLSLLAGAQVQILDGALVTESTVHLGQESSLKITHTAATRTLPGLVVLDEGALILTGGASLRVHGLAYVNRLFDVGEGARIEIVGSLVGNDPEISFRNAGASVVIQYDPAVLGTPGLRVPDGVVVSWVASWEELPSLGDSP